MAICRLLLTRNILLYSARVGLYGVGGMWWERVVVCKVSWGGPVTISIDGIKANLEKIVVIN